jgi:hypothetical protein
LVPRKRERKANPKMANGFKVHIDKLGVDNHINWSRKIKFLLTSKDLWEGVEDPVAHATQ